MASADDLRRLALGLEGTSEAPHFDRAAFKAARIYATLAADGLTANVKLPPEEQEFRCSLAPDALSPVPNAWGRQGWTTAQLASLSEDDLLAVLKVAWGDARPRSRPARRRRS